MAALASISDYKTYAGISGTALDTRLTALATLASARVRQMCGRDLTDGFESAARTELYDGHGGEALQLREWPVTTLTSVTLVADDGSETAYVSTDYRMDLAAGLIHRIGARTGRFAGMSTYDLSEPGWGTYPCWPEGRQNLEVVYTAGFATIPDDLKLACYLLIDDMLASGGQSGGFKSESIGDYSYTRNTPDERKALIDGLLAPYTAGGV